MSAAFPPSLGEWEDLQRTVAEQHARLLGLYAEENRLAGQLLEVQAKLYALESAQGFLFDGHAVYQEVRRHGVPSQRTSAENVSDVLDAVVRLQRAAQGLGTSHMGEG